MSAANGFALEVGDRSPETKAAVRGLRAVLYALLRMRRTGVVNQHH
jgi:hypothetical protein